MKTKIAKTVQKASVVLIASGYEWNCPHCQAYNKIIETADVVTCEKCGAECDVAYINHATPK